MKGYKGRKGMNAIGATPVADATGAAPQKISFAKILRADTGVCPYKWRRFGYTSRRLFTLFTFNFALARRSAPTSGGFRLREPLKDYFAKRSVCWRMSSASLK